MCSECRALLGTTRTLVQRAKVPTPPWGFHHSGFHWSAQTGSRSRCLCRHRHDMRTQGCEASRSVGCLKVRRSQAPNVSGRALVHYSDGVQIAASFDHSNSPLTGNVRVVPVSRVDAWATSEFLSFDSRASSFPTPGSRVGSAYRIEVMSSFGLALTETCSEQVYLMERDAGLLCRMLGLYSARTLDIVHVDYSHLAQDVMKLSVKLRTSSEDPSEFADSVRVLIAKASTFVGVIAVADHPNFPGSMRQVAYDSDA